MLTNSKLTLNPAIKDALTPATQIKLENGNAVALIIDWFPKGQRMEDERLIRGATYLLAAEAIVAMGRWCLIYPEMSGDGAPDWARRTKVRIEFNTDDEIKEVIDALNAAARLLE